MMYFCMYVCWLRARCLQHFPVFSVRWSSPKTLQGPLPSTSNPFSFHWSYCQVACLSVPCRNLWFVFWDLCVHSGQSLYIGNTQFVSLLSKIFHMMGPCHSQETLNFPLILWSSQLPYPRAQGPSWKKEIKLLTPQGILSNQFNKSLWRACYIPDTGCHGLGWAGRVDPEIQIRKFQPLTSICGGNLRAHKSLYKAECRDALVAESVKCLTFDSGSGRDQGHEIKPFIGLCTGYGTCLRSPHSLPLPLPSVCLCSTPPPTPTLS